MNDCPESQLVPPHAGDSGQLLLYFFYLWKTNENTVGAAGSINDSVTALLRVVSSCLPYRFEPSVQ